MTAPPPARCHRPRWLADGRSAQAGCSWYPERRASTGDGWDFKLTSGGHRYQAVLSQEFQVTVPLDRPAVAAGWCHLPQFPVRLKASCSWCTGPPRLDQQLPSGWYSWSSRLSELGPDAINTHTLVIAWCFSPNWEHRRLYLSTGDVDGCYQVSCMGIKSSDAAGHGRAHQVFVDVQLHQISRLALQHLHIHTHTHRYVGLCVYGSTLGLEPLFCLYLPDHLRGNSRLANHRLSSARNPVYGGGLLVGAVVAADRQDLRVRVLLLEPEQSLLSPLRKTPLTVWGHKITAYPQTKKTTRYLWQHVHAHGISCLRLEANVQVPPS